MSAEQTTSSLSDADRARAQEYLMALQDLNSLSFDDSPLDAWKVTEYLCMCSTSRKRVADLYGALPPAVRDLVPAPT